MEMDSKYFAARLIALEKDIKDYKSECATMASIAWQYKYLSLRAEALHFAIRAFNVLQFRFEVFRSPDVNQRVFKVITYKPKFELLTAVNRYQELNSQLFSEDDKILV